MKHLGKTRPFRGPDGKVVRGSIAEVNYFRLGGVDQWVMIRGESLSNPPLIFLHGGPGFRRWPASLANEIRTTTPDRSGPARRAGEDAKK